MQEIQYKDFSLKTHKKNWQINRPNVCKFELTFGCSLHCRHCYTDCYNKTRYLNKELSTKEVKFIIDKLHQAGAIWLCFTGGDPLTRPDFLDIYSYAKDKGFIITVFTNGYSITEEIVRYLKRTPPFVIEITLNAVTEELYEKISQVKGSFAKVMHGLNLILEANPPLKIKTKITKDNLEELPRIKRFTKAAGLRFYYDVDLFAGLNGDLAPCNLRLSPQEVLSLDGRFKNSCWNELDRAQNLQVKEQSSREKRAMNLFRCAIGGGDGINIDPYGNTSPCNLIRKPTINLLKVDIAYALNKLSSLVRNRKFATNSKCKSCNLREICHWCPGRAYVETGDMEAPIEYHCQLARETISRSQASSNKHQASSIK